MGAANVIPGVSGGTIALITGIYERLINAIKSVDHKALKLVLQMRFADFWRAVDGTFLASLLSGIAVSIISLAKLLEFLLEHYETHTMAFFFGLILLSIVFVGKTVEKWNASTLFMLALGTVVAISVALLAPASQDSSFFYVFLCGIVAICSMILPGLSGSFILIIMGNYSLILAAIGKADFAILIPLGLGCAFGLIAFSHLLAWIFKHFRDQTIALMTGFILGSLAIIWPWKTANIEIIARQNKPDKELVTGYDWALPTISDGATWQALLLVAVGALTIWGIEKFAGGHSKNAVSG